MLRRRSAPAQGARHNVHVTHETPRDLSQLPDGIRAHRRRLRTRMFTARVVGGLGVIGLASAVYRPAWRGMRQIDELLPLFPDNPHLLSRTAATTLVWTSVGLLLTSRGLRRGQELAWGLTLALLVASTALHVAKGPDVAEAPCWGVVSRVTPGVITEKLMKFRPLMGSPSIWDCPTTEATAVRWASTSSASPVTVTDSARPAMPG